MRPRLSYVIASTMRTGSYLLCEGLEATGVAGRPREIFCPERRTDYAGRWSLPDSVSFEDFLQAALDAGTTPNGVFGTKIHYHHVEPLAKSRGFRPPFAKVLRVLFPEAKFIHLRRRDLRAQAISWARAVQTNEWWRIADVPDPEVRPGPPQFHAPDLRRRELQLGRQEEAWGAFFADPKIDTLRMDYETLAADYRGEIARVLDFIGENTAAANDLPPPRLQLQADALSQEWSRRMDEAFPDSKSPAS